MPRQANTVGAFLIGSLVALFFSGCVSMQVLLYSRVYPDDRLRTKALVGLVWILDLVHSAMICVGGWEYIVVNFNTQDPTNNIHWTVITTIGLTALITFVVHCFYTTRLWTLSDGNLYIIVPIIILALLRLSAGLASCAQMSRLKTWDAFSKMSGWLFTMGLAASSVLDIVIAVSLICLLRRSRTGFSAMDHVIDTITVYTIENGLLTSITMTVTLILWIVMPDNLIFLAFHLAISKLYANSFLATLNARKTLQGHSQQSTSGDHPIFATHRFPMNFRFNRHSSFTRTHNGERTSNSRPPVQLSARKSHSPEAQLEHSDDTGSHPPLSPTLLVADGSSSKM